MPRRPRIRFRKPRGAQPEPQAPQQPRAGEGIAGSNPTASQAAESGRPAGVGQAPFTQLAAGQPGRAGGPGASQPQPELDPDQRVEGLRAWLAQVDRKLGVRTYIGAALLVLALAAAGVGLFLVLSLRQDAATKDDLDSLRQQLSGVEQSAAQAAQSGVRSLNQRLADLEDQVNKLSAEQTTSKRELRVIQDDIKELRSQASSGGRSGTGSTSLGTGLGGAGGTSP